MANLIKTLVKAVVRPDCHVRLECALKEAKERGFSIDRQSVAARLAGGAHAPKRV